MEPQLIRVTLPR